MKIWTFAQRIVTVGGSLTTINDQGAAADAGEAVGGLRDAEWYDIANVGAPLTDLQLQFQFYPGGTWRTILAVNDWTNIIAGTQALPGFLLGVSVVNPGTLASGSAAWFGIAPAGVYAHRLQGKCGTSTVVTVNAGGRSIVAE